MLTKASLADHLDALRLRLPIGLLPPGNGERLCDAVRHVPAAVVSFYGLECPLQSASAPADILFSSSVAHGGRNILTGQNPFVSMAWHDRVGEGWSRLRAFCRRWGEPDSPLFAGADDLWFEHDDGANIAARVPSFFFGVRVGAARGRAAKAAAGAILDEGLTILGGSPPPRAVSDVLDGLPDHARIFQAGQMLSRPDRQVRLCIDNLAAGEIEGLASSWRGSGEGALVGAAVGDVAAASPVIRLAVDVAGGVGPKIGLECYAQPPRHPPDADRWRPLLDHLRARGLCAAGRRNDLLRLPLSLGRGDGDAFWPDDLAQTSGLTGRGAEIQAWLHHVKVTCEAGRLAAAKAYVAVATRWLP